MKNYLYEVRNARIRKSRDRNRNKNYQCLVWDSGSRGCFGIQILWIVVFLAALLAAVLAAVLAVVLVVVLAVSVVRVRTPNSLCAEKREWV